MKPSPEQLHILQHSLGLDEYGQGNAYRNHFVTGPGTTDYPHCKALVNAGYMTERHGSELSGGDTIFCVTTEGTHAVILHSPKPPRLSRSKRRYRDWIGAERQCSFRQWLGVK